MCNSIFDQLYRTTDESYEENKKTELLRRQNQGLKRKLNGSLNQADFLCNDSFFKFHFSLICRSPTKVEGQR